MAIEKQTKRMKRTFIISMTALITAACSCFWFITNTPSMPPVSKNINVAVYKTASYVSPVYSNATATLEVVVVKVKNNTRDTVWQHSFKPTELKAFPNADNPFTQEVVIQNVNDAKECLEVYYNVVYNSKGSIVNCMYSTTIAQGERNGKLDIQI